MLPESTSPLSADPSTPSRGISADVQVVLDLVREISRQTDPQTVVNVFRKYTGSLYKDGSFVAISRRDLPAPRYRITRASRWDEEINPWTQADRLPLLEGGTFGDLLYGDTPRVIRDYQTRPNDPAHEYLRGARSLLALPMYEGGVALNMVVWMSPDPAGFDGIDLATRVLTANLFGRATSNLLAAKRLREAYAQLDHEMKRVADLQRSLLPLRLPNIPGVDIAASYKTAARAGGDYYDFFDLGDGRWGLWIADVSGHGTPAAVVMAILRTMLHGRCDCDSSPGAVLSFANRMLCAQADRYDEMFVTAFYGVYDPRDGSFDYACAGHNPPLLVDRRIRVRELDAAQALPLAVDRECVFPEFRDRLIPSDTLLLYTDGITDALNEKGEPYGRDRLLSCVREDVPSARHIIDCVTCKLQGFTDNQPQADDQTLVALRVRS